MNKILIIFMLILLCIFVCCDNMTTETITLEKEYIDCIVPIGFNENLGSIAIVYKDENNYMKILWCFFHDFNDLYIKYKACE